MTDETTLVNKDLRSLVARVAAAYFSASHVGSADIPTIIAVIAQSLGAVGTATPVKPDDTEAASRKLTAAQVRRSITPDGLVSFEDGKSYKTLKRHLSGHGLTSAEYRAKWGLPSSYPMVAPNYSAARSQMAKALGLGQMASKARAKAAGGPGGAKRGRGRRPAPAAAQ